MQDILCKYNEYILAPANAFRSGIIRDEFETLDGIRCRSEIDTVWNNENGQYDEELNIVCHKHYGCPFSAIRSLWFGRLGTVDKYWHLVKMVKV